MVGYLSDKISARTLAKIGRQVADRLDKNPEVYRIETEHADVFAMRGFLPADDCRLLIRMIDKGAEPSTLYQGEFIEGFRTSSSCNFPRWDEDIQRISQRIAGLLGLDVRQGETIQGQRYAVGQQFKTHFDYFNTGGDHWAQEEKVGGQRSWTAMVYLNEPKGGGETTFPHLGFAVKPETGLLLAWNNMDKDGRPNRYTAHTGSPVARGTKYIITNWFRKGRWVEDENYPTQSG